MARPSDADSSFVAGPLLDANEIRHCLDDLAAELTRKRAPTVELVVVGGSYLALRGLRESTRDVDTATALSTALRDAAAVVARAHDLSPRWLNDDARPFLPADFDRGACSVLLESPNLVVLGPTPDDIVMMKTYAAREADVADMVRLWPLCTFETPTAAAQRFAAAYPHAPDDPHLEPYFADIQRRAEAG